MSIYVLWMALNSIRRQFTVSSLETPQVPVLPTASMGKKAAKKAPAPKAAKKIAKQTAKSKVKARPRKTRSASSGLSTTKKPPSKTCAAPKMMDSVQDEMAQAQPCPVMSRVRRPVKARDQKLGFDNGYRQPNDIEFPAWAQELASVVTECNPGLVGSFVVNVWSDCCGMSSETTALKELADAIRAATNNDVDIKINLVGACDKNEDEPVSDLLEHYLQLSNTRRLYLKFGSAS